jgi:uncharacterized protein YecE (DUF72 family)
MSQFSLFDVGKPEPVAIGHAEVADEIRAIGRTLPASIRLGTSSWSFPGWKGIVYDRRASQSRLSREGLAAYSEHPVLGAVGIDRTYYEPLPASTFCEYAASVPEDFRFLVKAPQDVTVPHRRSSDGSRKDHNSRFLDPDWATREVVEPFVEGLGNRGGPLVFQFSPLGHTFTTKPSVFSDRLGAFLEGLPNGPWYAVELRDEALLTTDYVDVLKSTGATHCVNVHPKMASIAKQVEIAAQVIEKRLAVRWMLHSGFEYEEAKNRYAPFDRLVDEDRSSRSEIAKLALDTVKKGGETIVIANNKAEGSAPLTLIELAREIVASSQLLVISC